MIVDIRGTHGSGKSWIVHQLLDGPVDQINEDDKLIGYYRPGLELAVVGKYESECGGCDGVGSADEVCRRVRMFAATYTNVVLEGILVAHTFKRYSALATEVTQNELDNYVFCFLNTPLKKCISRVRTRRRAKGNRKEFDPRNVINDYKNIWHGVRKKCMEAGHRVVVLDYRDPLPAVYGLLQG
jgi:hypothetical protein